MLHRSLSFAAGLLAFVLTATAKELPYKGTASGAVFDSSILCYPPVIGGGPFMLEQASAEGSFTHLGQCKVSLNWSVSVDIDGIEVEGAFTITGAEGDSMWGSFSSYQDFASPLSVIEVVVLGGTGRFRGAHGTIPGTGERNDAQFSYTLNGRISLP
jgi:hypothetical protein